MTYNDSVYFSFCHIISFEGDLRHQDRDNVSNSWDQTFTDSISIVIDGTPPISVALNVAFKCKVSVWNQNSVLEYIFKILFSAGEKN